MKKLKIYLTEYDFYDENEDETFVFAGLTILAKNFLDARIQLFSYGLKHHRIINA